MVVTQPIRMENSMKLVHMGNNKSLVDLRGSINFNCMRVYPYGVDDSSLAAAVATTPFDSGSVPGNGAI